MTAERDMHPDPWRGDWRARIYERARAMGYSDITAFAHTAPAAPYRELAAMLGTGAPVQLEKILRDEAIAAQDLATFARDCLARYLHQNLPEGWGIGAEVDFRTARAFASWTVALYQADEARDHNLRTKTQQVWQRLHALAPRAWQPQGADDPVLQQALREFD